MTGLFDSAGYSAAGVWRRRLWAMALLKLLPSANSGVVKNLDQVSVFDCSVAGLELWRFLCVGVKAAVHPPAPVMLS